MYAYILVYKEFEKTCHLKRNQDREADSDACLAEATEGVVQNVSAF